MLGIKIPKDFLGVEIRGFLFLLSLVLGKKTPFGKRWSEKKKVMKSGWVKKNQYLLMTCEIILIKLVKNTLDINPI